MASRKTKKQKIIAFKKRSQNKLLIEQLENEKMDLLKKQEEVQIKYKNAKKIKNLKIFKASFKLIYPYCLLSLGVQLPVLIFHGGFPFVIDNYNYYKEKTLNISYEGKVNYQENYVTDNWYDDNTFPNKLTVTTPWVDNPDGGKRRTIREYNITYSDELADAILTSDYESLDEMLDNCSREVVETSNDPYLNDEYHLEGNLGTIDKSSSLKVPETSKDNAFVTNFEIILFILLSILIFKNRRFRFIRNLKELNKDYNEKKEDFEIKNNSLISQMEEIDQKVLAIKNRKV